MEKAGVVKDTVINEQERGLGMKKAETVLVQETEV